MNVARICAQSRASAAVLDAVRACLLGPRIALQTLLPTGERERNDLVVKPVNGRLAELALDPRYARQVSLMDWHAAFVDQQGQLISAYFVDGLHPNEDGYRVWRDRLVQFLEQQRRR